MLGQRDGRASGDCYVTFVTPAEAQRALVMNNKHMVRASRHTLATPATRRRHSRAESRATRWPRPLCRRRHSRAATPLPPPRARLPCSALSETDVLAFLVGLLSLLVGLLSGYALRRIVQRVNGTREGRAGRQHGGQYQHADSCLLASFGGGHMRVWRRMRGARQGEGEGSVG